MCALHTSCPRDPLGDRAETVDDPGLPSDFAETQVPLWGCPRIAQQVGLACDDEVIPSQERIETVGDDTDLEEVYNTERHLLYVACTRARDYLLVTGVTPASEFLDDLRMEHTAKN